MDKNPKWWHIILISFFMPVMTGLTILTFQRKGQSIDRNNEIIKAKADIIYVDSQDGKLKTEIDQKVSKESFAIFMESMKSMQSDVSTIKIYLINKPK